MPYLHAAKMCHPVLGGAADILFGEDKAPVSLAPPPPAGAPQAPVVASKADLQKQYLVALAGAVGGAVLWKRHRVLGFLAGGSAADAGYRYWRNQGTDRKDALYMAGVQAVAIGGAMTFKKSPALGYVGGLAAGHAASYFASKESPAHRYVAAMRAGTAPGSDKALPAKK